MSFRQVALVTLAVLAVATVVATIMLTPWHPLGAVPAVDRVTPRVVGDFTAAQVHASEQYLARARPPSYLGYAAGLLLALLLGLTPLGAGIVSALGRHFPGGWLVTAIAGTVVLLVISRVLTLPFSALVQAANRRAGLATQTWSSWFLDVVKSFGVSTVVSVAVIVAIVALARAWPVWWWAPAAALAAVLVIVLSFTYPLVVEPLFSRFTPMAAGPLRTSLLDLARSDGVNVSDVLVADASRRTTTLNAYVSGFGASRRIVVYDTLLEQAPPSQIRMVVAHELGHAKYNDVLHGTLLGALGAAAGVVALGLLLSWKPLLDTAGASSAGDPRVVALVLALVAAATFASSPVQSLVSRHIEARADAYALSTTRDPQTFAEMQRSLAVSSRADLTPPLLGYVWFASHPTAPQRIAMARTWAKVNGVPVPGPLVESGSP